MNTRNLLVSVLMLVSVLFSACASATAMPNVTTAVPLTDIPMSVPETPELLTSDPKALETVTGNYTYKVAGQIFKIILDSDGSYSSLASSGTFTVTANQITFVGSDSDCALQPGAYTWSLDNNVLQLTPVKDDCQRRAGVFGTQTFEKDLGNTSNLVVVWQLPAAVNGIAVDSLGNVYITNGSAGFFKYDTNGKLLGSWSGGLTFTTGIAVDEQGNMYVANFDPPEIHKFDPDGNPLLTWTIPDGIGPVGLAIDPQGNVYVALHRIHDHYVEKYDPQGKLLGAWAKPATAGGQIKAGSRTGPSFLAVAANGDNYIQDDEQAYKYDKDGNFLYSIPKHCSVAVDRQGNLYLFVSEDSTILKFDSNGNPIGKWSVPISGVTPGYSYGIAVDKDGNIFLYSGAVLAKINLPAQ